MSVNKSQITGDLAGHDVHSATIKNQTSNKVHCFVEYRTMSNEDNEIIEFDINGNGEEHKCEEKVHTTSSNNTSSPFSNMFPKIIYSIQVVKSDDSKLQIAAPFDNVPPNDVRNWKFIIDNDKIHSVEK